MQCKSLCFTFFVGNPFLEAQKSTAGVSTLFFSCLGSVCGPVRNQRNGFCVLIYEAPGDSIIVNHHSRPHHGLANKMVAQTHVRTKI